MWRTCWPHCRGLATLPNKAPASAGGGAWSVAPRARAADGGLRLRRCASSRQEACEAISADELFLMDLNGFIVVRGAVSAVEIDAANAAIEAHADDFVERLDPDLRNTEAGTPLAGDGCSGRRDLGGCLGWSDPHSRPFRSWLAHPKLSSYLTAFLGEGYRMDHLPLLISQHRGSEGFHLHGGPLTSTGRLNPTLQYRCDSHGTMYNSLVAMAVQLSDHPEGSGGFCVVRGSHKLNIKMPRAFVHGEYATEHVYQPTTKKGDVIFFSEATVHGALPWAATHERRVALYRFAPATVAYGRSYLATPSTSAVETDLLTPGATWGPQITTGMTDEQLAVMQPPYAERLDRPLLARDYNSDNGDGEGGIMYRSRNERKKSHDRDVFKTAYF